MHFIVIIPARYASSRFPGKPLVDLGGKRVIERVYEQAHKALQDVVVATDDTRIIDAVESFGGQAVMTSKACRCGTERCMEAWLQWAIQHKVANSDYDDYVIINVQGDEPFIQPEQIHSLIACFDTSATQIATLVKPYTEKDTWEELENPNSPKVVVANGQALFFSRSVIPYLRGTDKTNWIKQHTYYKHIGMYAYRADILEQITRLSPTPLEQAESLEQLRWLENGYTIRVGVTDTQTIGIDTPEDLEKAKHFIQTTLL